MHSSRRRAGYLLSVPMLAGWLFADLFLVLFIVAFSSQPTVALPKPRPVASAAHRPPLPKKRHGPQGLQSAPVDFKLFVSPTGLDSADPAVQNRARTQLLAGVHQQLASRHLLGRKAGFVLVFATSINGAADPINEALRVATSAIQDLQHYDPAVFPDGMGGEGLWAGTGDYFHFQIFFYTQ
jgi:hypothetical protein